jgi:hypothetical protein
MQIDWLILCNSAQIDFANNVVDITGAGADNVVVNALPVRIDFEIVVRLIRLPDMLDAGTTVLNLEVRDPDDNVVQLRDPDGGDMGLSATVTGESHWPTLPGRNTMLINEPIQFDANKKGKYKIVATTPGGAPAVTSSLHVM